MGPSAQPRRHPRLGGSAGTLAALRAVRDHDGCRPGEGLCLRPLPAALLALTTVLAVVSVPLLWGHELKINTVLYPATAVVLGLTGALIASRHSGSRVGWVLCGMGVNNALGEVISGYGYHLGWAGAVTAEWVSACLQMIDIGGYAILLAVFCSERASTPRSRAWVWAAALATALMTVGVAFGHSVDDSYVGAGNPHAVDSAWPTLAYVGGQLLLVVSLIASAVALIIGFRRSTGIERQQLKWVVYAVSSLRSSGPLAALLLLRQRRRADRGRDPRHRGPRAMCVAILRYRLYDIDVIINRTVVYGALTSRWPAATSACSLTLGALLGTPLGLGDRRRHARRGDRLPAVARLDPGRRRPPLPPRPLRRVRPGGRVPRRPAVRPGGATAARGVLRDALSRPDLEVAFALDDSRTFVDAGGREMTVAQPTGPYPCRASRSAARRRPGRPCRPGRRLGGTTDSTLMREALVAPGWRSRSPACRPRCSTSSTRSPPRGRGSSPPAYEERRRLERDLHDGAQQRLVSIGLALRHAQHQLGRAVPASADPRGSGGRDQRRYHRSARARQRCPPGAAGQRSRRGAA